MRTTIIFCILLIFTWLESVFNFKLDFSDDVAGFLGVCIMIFFVMDFFEFLHKITKE